MYDLSERLLTRRVQASVRRDLWDDHAGHRILGHSRSRACAVGSAVVTVAGIAVAVARAEATVEDVGDPVEQGALAASTVPAPAVTAVEVAVAVAHYY